MDGPALSSGTGDFFFAAPIFAAAIYGGYFGAGLSVIILAVLGVTLDDDLTRLNALKQAIAFAVNVAAALFLWLSGARRPGFCSAPSFLLL